MFFPNITCRHHAGHFTSPQLMEVCILSLYNTFKKANNVKNQYSVICRLYLDFLITSFLFGCPGCLLQHSSSLAVTQGCASPLPSLGFSRCRARALGCSGLGSVVRGLVAVLHRLSCPEVQEIFPEQGWNLCPLHWHVDS